MIFTFILLAVQDKSNCVSENYIKGTDEEERLRLPHLNATGQSRSQVLKQFALIYLFFCTFIGIQEEEEEIQEDFNPFKINIIV